MDTCYYLRHFEINYWTCITVVGRLGYMLFLWGHRTIHFHENFGSGRSWIIRIFRVGWLTASGWCGSRRALAIRGMKQQSYSVLVRNKTIFQIRGRYICNDEVTVLRNYYLINKGSFCTKSDKAYGRSISVCGLLCAYCMQPTCFIQPTA
jgi:hypothetical protein